MYGIYANIGGILMGSMLPYIAAPWILWVYTTDLYNEPIPDLNQNAWNQTNGKPWVFPLSVQLTRGVMLMEKPWLYIYMILYP